MLTILLIIIIIVPSESFIFANAQLTPGKWLKIFIVIAVTGSSGAADRIIKSRILNSLSRRRTSSPSGKYRKKRRRIALDSQSIRNR
jgi:hypothetical protein